MYKKLWAPPQNESEPPGDSSVTYYMKIVVLVQTSGDTVLWNKNLMFHTYDT
jgi:hypothetical protein